MIAAREKKSKGEGEPSVRSTSSSWRVWWGDRAPNHTNTSARGKSCRLVSGVEVGAWGRKETELESPPQLDSSVVAERAFPWVDFPRGGKCTFPALLERSEKTRRAAARGEEKEDEVEFSSGPNWNAGQTLWNKVSF